MNPTTPLLYQPENTSRCHYCKEKANYYIEQDGTPDPRYGTAKYLCGRCRISKEQLWIASAPYEEILANAYIIDQGYLLQKSIELFKRRLAGDAILLNWNGSLYK